MKSSLSKQISNSIMFTFGSWTIYIINLVVLIHNIAQLFKENKILTTFVLILIFNRTDVPGKDRCFHGIPQYIVYLFYFCFFRYIPR